MGKSNFRYLSLILAVLIIINIGTVSFANNSSRFTEVKMYDDVTGSNLSNISNVITSDILSTLTFDEATIWPSKERMSDDITPEDLIEYGKDPGLGIYELHELGYTGKGISVALFDQPLLPNHESYNNVDYTYDVLNPNANMLSSMHGPAVMSLLAGKELGTAPDVKVHYYAYPSWDADQKNEADLFYDVIEKNKKLPDNKKIRVISMSHGVDNMKNSDLLAIAEEKAREAGIIVVDVHSMLIRSVRALPFTDKNNPNNYVRADWGSYQDGALYVPTGRTTADGYTDDTKTDRYVFYEGGGLSWAVPYVAGVIALGLQVDPSLTEEDAFNYLHKSGYDFHGGKLINPKGFIAMVTENSSKMSKDYRIYLYNKDNITAADKMAIDNYIKNLTGLFENILIDTSEYTSAIDIFNMLKEISKDKAGICKGVQIFGIDEDVPAFNVHYKVQMTNGIDDGGLFKSDHFYSSFDSTDLKENISIYDIFNDKLNVDIIPQWPVGRLPLTKGEFTSYFSNYYDYRRQIIGQEIPFIDFSSPIFNAKRHNDDTGILLDRMSKEFKMIDKGFYKLYGNTKGIYPVETEVSGDFSKVSLKKENKKGIMNLSINSHGQWNNIDQYVVTVDNKYSKEARSKDVNSKGENELRISLVNMSNINNVLSQNYYTLFSRSCLNAYGLNNNNIIHEAMSKGKMISTISNSTVNSNNGMDVYQDLKNMKKNNPAYNYLLYVDSLSKGNTMSDSFYEAKKGYAAEITKDENRTFGDRLHGNYQFQVLNVLSQHYLGILEDSNKQGSSATLEDIYSNLTIDLTENDSRITPDIIYGNNDKSYTLRIITDQEDDNLEYSEIPSRTNFANKDFKLIYTGVASDEENIYLKLKYTSPIKSFVFIFLQQDTPGLKELFNDATRVGDNTIIFKFKKGEVKGYNPGLAINIGERNFVFINNKLMDELANTDN